MNSKNTIKKILIGLVVALLILVAYAVINKQEGSSNPLSSLSSLKQVGTLGQIQETDTALANAEILKILGNIEDIQLNDEIFINPIFKELSDSRFTIPKPLQIGRPNPFLPIGFDAIANVNQQGSSNPTNFNELNPQANGTQQDASNPTEGGNQENPSSDFFNDFANTQNTQ